MAADVSGSCFKFNTESTGGTWSWTVRSNNLQGLGQLYEVVDIYTPWGSFYIAEIPLPGDVVSAMSDSLTSVQDQLAPLLALVNPSSTMFNVIIVEGDSNQEVAEIAIMNVGAFGSFMTATATPSAAWLSATPSSITSIGRNEQGTFTISLLTSTLLNSGSPYSGTMTIQDNRVPPTLESITINVTVLPRPTIGTSPTSISLTYNSVTGVPGGAQQLTITNSGPASSSLEYIVADLNNNMTWLDFIPTSGGPLASGISDIVTLSVDSARASSLTPGTYQGTMRVSSTNATNSPVDITVTLTVV